MQKFPRRWINLIKHESAWWAIWRHCWVVRARDLGSIIQQGFDRSSSSSHWKPESIVKLNPCWLWVFWTNSRRNRISDRIEISIVELKQICRHNTTIRW
nr:hypothetical protein Iba_chr10aCG12210 [Ipomoea batatas]